MHTTAATPRLPRSFCTPIAVLALAGLACAQGVVWGQLVPPSSPPGRFQHCMAHDAARQRTVVYGGYNNAAGLADTWEWNGTTWSLRAASSPPAIRRWSAMAYDAARARIVMFGGQSTAGTYPTETWTWDGTTWTAHAVPGPGQRWRHAMAYDEARQRVVLFGGAIPGIGGSFWNDQTWEWDGTAWTQRTPAVGPAGRQLHAMTYDAARQRVVVHGGLVAASTYAADTWSWDGTAWTAATPATVPPPRAEHAMVYDPTRQQVVMFGGFTAGLGGLQDTWRWNGTDWTQDTPPVRPSARYLHTMAFHAASGAVLLFGGGLALADTWSTYTPASATAYGTGCGSPALGFVPDPAARPLVGQTARADVTNTPTPLVAVAMGLDDRFFGAAPLPLPLDFLGMPGCVLLQSTDVLGLGTTPVTATTSSFAFAVPNVPVALGKHLYVQAYALAPGFNPLWVVASNAIDWLLGNV